MPLYTKFVKVDDVKELTFTNIIRENLIEFFNWGMLEIHGYSDVPVVGLNTANPNLPGNFFAVHQPGVADGTIWQSLRPNWVWETGLESGDVPVAYGGVYVNGVFHASNSTGTFAHYADYVNGRIVFASPIATTSIVQAAYSHRWLSIYDQDIPWFKSIILEQFETDQQAAAGFTSLLRDNKIKLPAIVIEHGRRLKQVPRQLGDLSQWVSVDYLFHVLAETDVDLTTVVDIVTSQKDSVIYLYDANARAAANAMPLDWRGALNPGAKTFPELVQEPPVGFRWQECRFTGMNAQDSGTTLPVFKAVIRVTVEVAN
jgi:hypothetical protein